MNKLTLWTIVCSFVILGCSRNLSLKNPLDPTNNNTPGSPSRPAPANGATNISVNPTLSWSCSDPNAGDTLKYDVYFGLVNPPVTIVSSDQSDTILTRSGLANNTTYYWRITAKDNHGTSITSQVWNFVTIAGGSSIEWISIPAGNFTMGSIAADTVTWPNTSDEYPQHTVYLDAYQIGKYEVTNAQYKSFIDAGGYTNSAYWTTDGWSWRTSNNITEPYYWTSGQYNSGIAFPNHPVVGVCWYEADAFCQWAGGHLPTEAQWEKAARYTDARYYPWGSTWNASNCNCGLNTAPDTFTNSSPVGFFTTGASQYGVYDMAGNVWEWVNDWYSGTYYSVSPSNNPTGPTAGTNRVVRGGCFGDANSDCRVAFRPDLIPSNRGPGNGFRIAK